MKKRLCLIFLFISGMSLADNVIEKEYLDEVAKLRDYALTNDLAYTLTESLTTEVGPRLAGSEGDAKAVEWAKAKFKELNFDKVYTQPVTFKRWIRGEETADVLSPFKQELKITALGGSYATPKEGIKGELVHFKHLDDLKSAADSEVKGKIVFISNRMTRARDGSGYGPAVAARSQASMITAQKGGIGVIIRSIGTDHNRDPHTGYMKSRETIEETGEYRYFEEKELVPAGAVSNPDADLLMNIFKRNQPVVVKYTLGSHWGEDYTSQNVIGEITGSEKPDEVIVIGGHLDSWDLGTGAIDDASGCAITMAAAKLIKDAGLKPKRTIRVILWANEEYGLSGANAYAKANENNMHNHMIGAESDFGAGRIYAFASRISNDSLPFIDSMEPQVAALAIDKMLKRRHGNVDDFEIIVPASLLNQQNKTQQIFTIVMSSIAGISLLVGGIGIMNIMLATILERTKEIGLMRALGARKIDIRNQFLVESATISAMGALLGIIMGVLLSFAIQSFADWPVQWSVFSILLAVGVCLMTGIGFGYYPAKKAAELDPILALQKN